MIEFSEYLQVLSILSTKATAEEKLRFSYKIYDFDGDNIISRSELGQLLQATAEENELVLSPEQLESVIDATFAEIPGSDNSTVNFQQYSGLLENHPMMLAQLTLNISSLITEQLQGGEIPLAGD